jgi:hypothetical protein
MCRCPRNWGNFSYQATLTRPALKALPLQARTAEAEDGGAVGGTGDHAVRRGEARNDTTPANDDGKPAIVTVSDKQRVAVGKSLLPQV